MYNTGLLYTLARSSLLAASIALSVNSSVGSLRCLHVLARVAYLVALLAVIMLLIGVAFPCSVVRAVRPVLIAFRFVASLL